MFGKIINPKFIKVDSVLKEYIKCETTNEQIKTDLIKSIDKRNEVKQGDKFQLVDVLVPPHEDFESFKSYIAIKNNIGTFLVREDNLELIEEPQDILEDLGIKRIIKNGNKTILIDMENNKVMTTRDNNDKDDPEKAIMILLLKYAGYNIKDVYNLVDLIK